MSQSYSALLRRSKLASYNPSLEQVYTSSSGQLSRSQFGFKRPLPSATTTVSPFVRVNNLDNSQKRTEFRKGTREALFVQKWDEINHQVATKTSTNQPAPSPYAPTVQSRFVPAAFVESFGGAELAPEQALVAAQDAVARAPNFVEWTEQQFNAWLESLTQRRGEFAAFVAADAARGRGAGAAAEEVNLFAHAQKDAKDLLTLLNQFLAQTTPSPLLGDKLIPHPHRTLGLQYAPITPLESSFAAPVPGRFLGSSASGRNERNATVNLASVMGQAAQLFSGRSAGLPPTNFFPDASGERNPAQGSALFIPSAAVAPTAFATRLAVASSRGRKPFGPTRGANTEASALFERVVELNIDAVSPGSTARPLPGSIEFSGNQAESRRSKDYFGLAGLFEASEGAGKGEPNRNIGRRRPSFQQNQTRLQTKTRLAGNIKKQTQRGSKKNESSSILNSLEMLLNK